MAYLGLVALLVRDYDEAIEYFTGALGFTLREDLDQGNGKRWVVVDPPGGETGLLLARAVGDEQQARVGDQHGGRVGFFLNVHDFSATHMRMSQHGVRFEEEPRHEVFGTVAIFRDLYGNRWDLVQLT
ncbi:VOC family protein [Actinophytocola oryzae]|uniref:Catechol 2,3-dioxygenase-like lactoylglutathione lyase family enzyme n=1 Tax=Actinophytocola oryzae TaxID=502181 RepID=A0A4R7VAT2_9PSEU|nr:VOC family protein [Actinophytocola oryzae]TDV46103.1 catechol 2,3-dioxygenase-like lactoylglutathione lyase family enzyme [Actinophytocola oryzae]